MFGRAKKLLPEVAIFGFIGPIPKHYGGRTGACFQRTSAFADLDHRTIDILNVSPAHSVNCANLNSRLHKEGRLSTRVTIRNIWNELRTSSSDQLANFSDRSPEPFTIDDDELERNETFVSKRYAADGALLQIDWFRDDGSRAVSDRRDANRIGGRSGRTISIYDQRSKLINQWSSTAELYKNWFQWIFGDQPTILVSDTPAYAFVRDLGCDNVSVIQAIHSIHGNPPDSKTATHSAKNYPVLANMDQYDKVAILTSAQKDDLKKINIGSNNMAVLPNMIKTSSGKRRENATTRTSGIALARLVKAKRIDHAILGTFEASKTIPDLTLDIYGGDGNAQSELESLIIELGMEKAVRLRGYSPKASSEFGRASFSLLTSISEGQGLVILESMAAGCIPIAYDIAYGPSDIISHGVDGFLVPNGDLDALAQAIIKVTELPDRTLRRMRRAAVIRSRDFRPRHVAEQWAEVMRQTLAEKRPTKPVGGAARLTSLDTAGPTYHFDFSVDGLAEHEISYIGLSWLGRKNSSRLFGRELSEVVPLPAGSAEVEPARLRASKNATVDFYVDLHVAGQPRRIRLRTGSCQVPAPRDGLEFYTTKNGFLSALATG